MIQIAVNPEYLLNSTEDIWMFWKDNQGLYLGCNEKMAEDLQLDSRHEIIGKSDFDFFKYNHEAEFYIACDQRVKSVGKTMSFTETVTLPTLTNNLTAIKSPLIDAIGHVTGVLGISFCQNHEVVQVSLKDKFTHLQNNARSQPMLLDGIALTKRESEIAYHLIMGRSAKDISKTIGSSPRTVEKQLERLKDKFNVKTKGQLIEKLIQNLSTP